MDTRTGGSSNFLIRTAVALREQRLACLSPYPVQQRVLDDLVRQATQTAFGREHRLAGIRTQDDWRRAMPVRAYQSFRPYVDRIIDGEPEVLTTDRPYALLTTSGTSGTPKLIPTTRHWRQRYRGPALYAQWGLYFQLLGLEKVVPETALDLSWDRTAQPGRAGELPVYGITQRRLSLGGSDWTPPWYGSPWFAGRGPSEDRMYTHLCWLAGKDVRLIVSVNPSKVVRLGEQLAQRTDDLVRDVYDGTVSGVPVTGLEPRPAEGRRLEGLASARGGSLGLEDVFPALTLLVCWMSGPARLYETWLRSMAPNSAILPFSTTGTEGIVTLPVDNHASAGPLAANQALYEFAEIDSVADDRIGDCRWMGELEVGRSYRLIMSQANGMYRYDTGDAYQMVGWCGRVPRLEFLGRVGHTASFTGEKLTEHQVHLAVRRAWPDPAGDLPMFTAVPLWHMPPLYVLLIERLPRGVDARQFAAAVETHLSSLNSEYAVKRSSGRLGAIRAHLLPAGAFEAVAKARRDAGVAAAQVKHHWLQRDTAIVEALRAVDRLGNPTVRGVPWPRSGAPGGAEVVRR